MIKIIWGVLFLGLTNLVYSQTMSCDNPNPYTKLADPGHWYSPAAFNNDDKTEQCNSCNDSINWGFKSCAVDRFLRSAACQGESCSTEQGQFKFYREAEHNFILQYDTRYLNTLYSKDPKDNCRFLLWALDPVIGVEDRNHRSLQNYWLQAYQASQSLVTPAFPIEHLALAMQPATTRGQHQLHIHMGTLAPSYQDAIDKLPLEDSKLFSVTINGYTFIARYVPNKPGQGPFAEIDVFSLVTEMIPGGETNLPQYGILGTIAPKSQGVWLLAALGFDRIELNYHQNYKCSLN